MDDSVAAEAEVDGLIDALLTEHPPAETQPDVFWGAQFDLGLAWVHFPRGRGGLALDPQLQERIDEALRAAHAPSNILLNTMGIGMAGPTIVAHGSSKLQEELLRRIFTCEDIWCQLFSEPGAGSDLAALATRAVRGGDEWVVNGQKVWTTLAHIAKWGLLLARTDPDVPKHKGLTYFIVDMHAAGVEVRPLRQLTGDAEFNEVYFTDVRIADACRLGDVGEGWGVALTTLMNERVAVGAMGMERRGQGDIRHAVTLWHKRGDGNPVRRDELTRLWIQGEVIRLTFVRAQQLRDRGTPGPEGSILKIAQGQFQQRLSTFMVHLLGAEGMLVGGYEMRRATHVSVGAIDIDAGIQKAFLAARGVTIGGGTTEIARNVIGERVLGLPGEPRDDKDGPWSEIPR